MTELLFQTDSYLQEFDANISSVLQAERAVVLDRTAFYPGGGGQPCDFGTFTVTGMTYPVDKVKKQGEDVLHFLGGDAPLPSIGSAARGALGGTVFRDYGALVTGGDMEPLKGRMDFEFETMRGELVREIEAAVNREVAEAREIRVKILPREQAFQIPDLIRTKINLLPEGIMQVRTVEIVGLDLQADGGTHVHNTNEVGTIPTSPPVSPFGFRVGVRGRGGRR